MSRSRTEESPPKTGGEASPVTETAARATSQRPFAARFRYLRALGPGLVTGASDDDPSGIATYSQAGSTFGLGLLWTSLLTFPLMTAVQEICDRIALATGATLGDLVRRRFPLWGRSVVAILMLFLLAANAMNIAADLVAIGAGLHLLHAGPIWLWALLAGIGITALLMSGSFVFIARVFKLLCLALFAYIAVLFMVNVDWGAVALSAFVPHIRLSSNYVALLVAVLGTTISPYLFFWQNLHRVEEMREEPEGGRGVKPLPHRSPDAAKHKQRTSRFDVFSGMALSNIVMFAIIVACAATLGRHGHPQIDSASQAASALRPIAGSAATLLFALGFIGTGMLAVPVLAGSASAGAAGLFGKTCGFSRSIRKAPWFYGLVALSTLGGTAMSLAGANPIKLLVLVAVINGVAAGPFLVIVMLIGDDRRLMKHYANGRLARIMGWSTALLMTAAAVVLFATGGLPL